MRLLPLSQGLTATVDDDDYESVGQYKWSAAKRTHTYYAVRNMSQGSGKWRLVYLHRVLLDLPTGVEVDHINGDGLDNRRVNLRPATRSLNNVNREVFKPGYRGVQPDPRNGHWVVHIAVEGRSRWVGSFQTAIEAAQAYDRAVVEQWGAFAHVNFPQLPLTIPVRNEPTTRFGQRGGRA